MLIGGFYLISKKAIVYKLSIELKLEKYFIIANTLDLEQTKKDTYEALAAGTYKNQYIQNLYNEVINNINKDYIYHYISFEVLESFRPDFYKDWLIPKILEFVESKFIEEAKAELKAIGKEHLLLN